MFSKRNYLLIGFGIGLAQISLAQYQPAYTSSQEAADLKIYQNLPPKTKAKYNYIAPCREKLSPAFVDSLCAWALLDSAGHELLMPRYSELQILGNGLISATRTSKKSYWLHKAPKLIPLQYEEVSWWAEDQLFVSANQQKGIINSDGTGIVPLMYDEIIATPQSLLVRRGLTWLRLDAKNGAPLPLAANPQHLSPKAQAFSLYTKLFPRQIKAIAWKDGDNYLLLPEANTAKTIADNNANNTAANEPLINPQKYPIHYSGGNIAFLQNETVFYPYELDTKSQKNSRYDKITPLSPNGIWAVAQITSPQNNPTTNPKLKWGIIDQKGNILVDITHDTLIIDSLHKNLIHLSKSNSPQSPPTWGLWQVNSQTWLATAEQKTQTIALANDIWAAAAPQDNNQPNTTLFYLWHKDSKGQKSKIKAFENIPFEAVRYLSPQYFAAKTAHPQSKTANSPLQSAWSIYALDPNAKNPPQNLLPQNYADIKSQKNHLFEVSSDGKSYFFVNLQSKKPACP